MPGWLKKLLSPKVLIPLLVTVGAIALLFSFGNPKKILQIMESFNRVDLIWVFLLSVLYEAVRYVQWHFLLKHEGVNVPFKAQIFSFAGGEATRFVPIGNYFQNYLLTVAEGTDFAYTSAATTLIILFEVAVCLTGLVILGLGSWWWIRPVVAVGIIVTALIVWLMFRFRVTLDLPNWARRNERIRTAWETTADELWVFAEGAKRILQWRTLAISYGLAAIYVVTGGGILYVVLAGLGWHSTSFGDVLAVYFFSLAFGLIFPLPVDIGVTELSGVGAFLVVGVDRDTAISAMLVNRVLTTGFSIVIGIIVFAVLHDELRKALHARGAKRTGQFGYDADAEQKEHVLDSPGRGPVSGVPGDGPGDHDAARRVELGAGSPAAPHRQPAPDRPWHGEDPERARDVATS